MTYFNFTRLIKKYSTPFIVELPGEADIDDSGDYQEGQKTQQTMVGAIISHRESKVFRQEGTLTQQDRALYTQEPLNFALETAKIIYQGKYYSISSMLENEAFTGVYAYVLKYVSVFDEVQAND